MRFSQIFIVASLVAFATAAPLRSNGPNMLAVRHNTAEGQSNPSGGNGQLPASEETAAEPSLMDMTPQQLKEYQAKTSSGMGTMGNPKKSQTVDAAKADGKQIVNIGDPFQVYNANPSLL